jgi:hypothetical protein
MHEHLRSLRLSDQGLQCVWQYPVISTCSTFDESMLRIKSATMTAGPPTFMRAMICTTFTFLLRA